MVNLLLIFLGLRMLKFGVESWLSNLNRSYYLEKRNQEAAKEVLGIPQEEFDKALSYSTDNYFFARSSTIIQTIIFFVFLVFGGFGYFEALAIQMAAYIDAGSVATGLFFFSILGLSSMVLGLPFDYYHTFVVEEKHGFNRQNIKGFFSDRIKGLIIGAILGGSLLAGLLSVMEYTGDNWWIWAWVVLSGFSLFASWLYPSLLAPLFNKFSPIQDGELKDKIFTLAQKVNFRTSGIYIMDASRRSSHGNAYFTGLFGEKRIVLFDTLVKSMKAEEIVAVLAHELGHFKLNHVRWGLMRGILMTGVMFFALHLALPMEAFYTSFAFSGVTNYGALVVFSLWFGLIDFFLTPIGSWISRKNEFAADRFAYEQEGSSANLVNALIKLRESNHSMPISHPVYSAVYHSHPPLLERISVLKGLES